MTDMCTVVKYFYITTAKQKETPIFVNNNHKKSFCYFVIVVINF